MKKGFIFIICIVSLFNIYAYKNDSLSQLEKIRWVCCWEDDPEFYGIEKMNFIFTIPTAKKYYKFLLPTKHSIHIPGEGGFEKITIAHYVIGYEIRDGYFNANLGKEFDDEKIEKMIKTHNISKLGRLRLPIQKDYVVISNEKSSFDLNDLTGIYLSPENKVIYVNEISYSKDMINVFISEGDGITDVFGSHFLTFDGKNTLQSDKTISVKYGEFYNSRDDFTINIEKLENKEIYLETKKLKLCYVPMEEYFTDKTEFVALRNKSTFDTIKDVCIYKESSKNSQIIKTIPEGKSAFAKILQTKDYEEIDNEISKWVKVKLDKEDVTGWVWGMSIEIPYMNSAIDREKRKLYSVTNTIKN